MYIINDIVKVKQGVLEPEWEEFEISGWQGNIVEIVEPDEPGGEMLYTIEWDSMTIQQIPKKYLAKSEEEGYDVRSMTLYESDVEPAKHRPAVMLSQRHSWDEQSDRIIAVIQDEELNVNQKTLQRYAAFLDKKLERPCLLTGIEDFKWEEFYVFGGGSRKEYEELKKTRASYRDTFELLALQDLDESHPDIFVKVKRVTDKKKFTLLLSELEAFDKNSANYQLLNDFSVWIVNYQ